MDCFFFRHHTIIIIIIDSHTHIPFFSHTRTYAKVNMDDPRVNESRCNPLLFTPSFSPCKEKHARDRPRGLEWWWLALPRLVLHLGWRPFPAANSLNERETSSKTTIIKRRRRKTCSFPTQAPCGLGCICKLACSSTGGHEWPTDLPRALSLSAWIDAQPVKTYMWVKKGTPSTYIHV